MKYDVIVIGAGAVGLAAANKFASSGYRTLVVEKGKKIGAGMSSRNSEVIHSGIYYPPDSLKARLCLEGKIKLYEWCEKKKISHRKCGKYIIAYSEAQLELLDSLLKNAQANGIFDLKFATGVEIKSKENVITTLSGLYSPTAGIISAHEFMNSLKQSAEEYNCDFVFNSKIASLKKNSFNSVYLVEVENSSGEIASVETDYLINCSGLYSDQTAELLGVKNKNYKIYFVKGDYFKIPRLRGKINSLIYPVMREKRCHLGVHLTISLDGTVKLGPDYEPMNDNIEYYKINESKKTLFFELASHYIKGLKIEDIEPDASGIRARLKREDEFSDFIIKEESISGFPNLINCVGIDSPGLTASMAIGEYIYKMIID